MTDAGAARMNAAHSPIKGGCAMPTSDLSSATGTFGPNLWLVEEMHQLFLDDPSAVDASWHEFFADYQPVAVGGTGEVADRLTSPRFGGPSVPEAPAEKVATADSTVADATHAPVATPTQPASGSASKAARPNAVAEQGTSPRCGVRRRWS
jgi:2-oxoglutarate decarboxylase